MCPASSRSGPRRRSRCRSRSMFRLSSRVGAPSSTWRKTWQYRSTKPRMARIYIADCCVQRARFIVGCSFVQICCRLRPRMRAQPAAASSSAAARGSGSPRPQMRTRIPSTLTPRVSLRVAKMSRRVGTVSLAATGHWEMSGAHAASTSHALATPEPATRHPVSSATTRADRPPRRRALSSRRRNATSGLSLRQRRRSLVRLDLGDCRRLDAGSSPSSIDESMRSAALSWTARRGANFLAARRVAVGPAVGQASRAHRDARGVCRPP
jgi:hypothetical protein